MARRVNTKFVVIMAASLAAAVAGVGGIWVYKRLQSKDPTVVKTIAETQEKDALAKLAAGKTEDGIKSLKMAVENFSWAGSLTSQKHLQARICSCAWGGTLPEDFQDGADSGRRHPLLPVVALLLQPGAQ